MPDLRLLIVDSAAFTERHALARHIAAQDPDVAVVHGAPSLARWRSTCAAIAREAGLVVVGGGRTAGGSLVLSDLGVDVEAQREAFVGSQFAARPDGVFAASMRRLEAPFAVVTGRVPAGWNGLEAFAGGVDPARPPRIVALAGTDVAADEQLAARPQPVTGGTLVELTLAEIPA